jgi:hypothetical protein
MYNKSKRGYLYQDFPDLMSHIIALADEINAIYLTFTESERREIYLRAADLWWRTETRHPAKVRAYRYLEERGKMVHKSITGPLITADHLDDIRQSDYLESQESRVQFDFDFKSVFELLLDMLKTFQSRS